MLATGGIHLREVVVLTGRFKLVPDQIFTVPNAKSRDKVEISNFRALADVWKCMELTDWGVISQSAGE